MKKTTILIPLAAAAVGAAVLLLGKKSPKEPAAAEKKPAAPAPVLKNSKSGSYEFISGLEQPRTVTVTLSYDGETGSFDVIGEEFPVYSSDSHVAVLYGEEYMMQMEYAAFYPGESFAQLTERCAAEKKSFVSTQIGEYKAFRYVEGDSACVCIEIPGDTASYLHLSILKTADSDIPLTETLEQPKVSAVLATIHIA